MFTEKQINAALHTLWQAAVASGGVGEIAKSLTDHSVNVPGVEQGVLVAGVAVGGAALSLAKSALINYLTNHKMAKAVRYEAALEAAVADYIARHQAPVMPVGI